MIAGAGMSDAVVESLILDLLEWVARQDRTYEEVMDAWRTSCPKLPVWEDANDRGLLAFEKKDGQTVVKLTAAGKQLVGGKSLP
jgi:D-3-phosphoglycerate dehydrogenase